MIDSLYRYFVAGIIFIFIIYIYIYCIVWLTTGQAEISYLQDFDQAGDETATNTTQTPNGRIPDKNITNGTTSRQVSWQTVLPGMFYVYSAFNAGGEIHAVTLMHRSMTKLNARDMEYYGLHYHFRCDVSAPGDVSPEPSTTQAQLRTLSEHHEQSFLTTVLTCPMSAPGSSIMTIILPDIQTVQTAPHHVSVASDIHEVALTFVVCVSSPVHGGYSDTLRFVEWVELNLQFGADLIVLYDYNAGSVLYPYITYYIKRGVMVIRPWSFPPDVSTDDLNYFAQIAAINDCLHIYKHRTKFLVFSDLDEFIVPRNDTGWIQMITSAISKGVCDSETHEYNIRNVFFNTKLKDDDTLTNNQTVKAMGLVTLLKTLRVNEILPAKTRSKYIVRPLFALAAGVHTVYRWSDRKPIECTLPPEVALLHHYRRVEADSDTQTDRHMHHLADTVINRVQHVHQAVNQD